MWVRWKGARRWHLLERRDGKLLVLACNREMHAPITSRERGDAPAARVCEACRLISTGFSAHGTDRAGEHQVVPAVQV